VTSLAHSKDKNYTGLWVFFSSIPVSKNHMSLFLDQVAFQKKGDVAFCYEVLFSIPELCGNQFNIVLGTLNLQVTSNRSLVQSQARTRVLSDQFVCPTFSRLLSRKAHQLME